MSLIEQLTGLLFRRYHFDSGVLKSQQTGSYDRKFNAELKLFLDRSEAYYYNGNRATEQDGIIDLNHGYISSFACRIPCNAQIKEYWDIDIDGNKETFDFSGQSESLKSKYHETHKQYDTASISVENGNGTEVGSGNETYITIPANHSENYKVRNVSVSSTENVTQTKEVEVWQVPMEFSYIGSSLSYNYDSDTSSVPSQGGTIIVYVNNFSTTRTKLWADGFSEDVSDSSYVPSSISVSVVDEDDVSQTIATGSNSGTMSDAVFRISIPSNSNAYERYLRVRISVAYNGQTYNNSISLVQAANEYEEPQYLPPIITSISVSDISASGGSVSRCRVYWKQSMTDGSSESGNTYISFATVRGYNLGTTPTNRELISTVAITFERNGLSTSDYVDIYQEANTVTHHSGLYKNAYTEDVDVYGIPVVNLSYGDISSNGGTVYPSYSASQSYTKGFYTISAEYRDYDEWTSGSIENEVITGGERSEEYEVYAGYPKYITTGFSWSFSGASSNGAVSASPSSSVSRELITTVTAYATLNGQTGSDTANVYQEAISAPVGDVILSGGGKDGFILTNESSQSKTVVLEYVLLGGDTFTTQLTIGAYETIEGLGDGEWIDCIIISVD